jgi:transcriptional regulator GlxA family with amidase domain
MDTTRTLPKHRFVFLTLPDYTMVALVSAIDALRMANRVTQRDVYEWILVSVDGRPVAASNGLSIGPTTTIDQMGPANIVFVCGGTNVREAVTPTLLSELRRLAERHVPLGSLCTGGYALAKAGLLNKYRAVIHWENMSTLQEEFPQVQLSDRVFAIDRDRYTCSSGVAPLDLMLNIIKQHQGRDIAPAISEQFILDRIRGDPDRQLIPLKAQVGVYHENLLEAARLMREHIEEPLALDEVAAAVGVSRRQIERLFKRHVGQVPTRYYLEQRLRRARELLLQTSMSIMDVAVACGFQSPPHFSKCYRTLFGCTPSMERQGPGRAVAPRMEEARAASELPVGAMLS